MAYLGLALFAEGATDYRFFAALLTRVVEEVYYEKSRGTLDLGPILELQEPEEVQGETRAQRIASAAGLAAGAFHLLFVHADGDGNARVARAAQVDPGIQLFLRDHAAGYAAVPVVPVREMEAWAIADGDALRLAFGTTLSDDQLGLPRRARDCERETNPKRVLEAAYEKVTGGRSRGRGKTAAAFLDLIGATVSLRRLGEFEAFRALRTDVTTALETLGLRH